ncbi:MAG: nuclear transport factor 2 family protein [Chloroflexota bacterium]|nr:nuclear transport factor 2 family protein [Chloroflexota bacterium]
MNAHQSIVDVLNGVAIYADLRQWEQLQALYADEVAVDYTSLVGGAPGQVKADELIASWQTGLGRYRATQHLLGNHRVRISGDQAQALVYVQATHWLPQPDGDSTWTVHGYYDYTLTQMGDAWCITRHMFTATIVHGARTLLEMQGVKAEWLTTSSNG